MIGMIKKYWGVFILILLFVNACKSSDDNDYLNKDLPFETRINDLISRMTLDEKIAQMCQFVGLEHIKEAKMVMDEKALTNSDDMGFYPNVSADSLKEMIKAGLTGSFLHVKTIEEANYLQKLAQESRLKIPLLIGIDAIHGNGLYNGATIYPTPIGMASTWDFDLVKKSSVETAKEMRAMGSHWAFTPNVDVARDARWGRVGETFGEDPFLVSQMGVAMVEGFQGDDFTSAEQVIACAKHLIAGSVPVNGMNAAPSDISERTLREVFLPPFKAIIDAGVYSVMAAHNELNGIPCHAHKRLMEDVLRDEMGFEGFYVSDWMDIERLADLHFVAENEKEACFLSVDAGMDMHMHGPRFHNEIKALVLEGRLSEARIDNSVSRILEAKFRLGLFENPFVDAQKADEIIFSESHKATSLKMAEKSLVLLKNDGVLPLDTKKYNRILVTGPNANNQSLMGDWTMPQPEENVTTIFEGIKKSLVNECEVDYFNCGEVLLSMQDSKIKEAGRLAANYDLTVVVVGENSMRYKWDEKTCGENTDRTNIQLPGKQQELVETLHAAGKPVVVVLLNGRPLGVEWIANNVSALIEAWEPGSFGGDAVANLIMGSFNPSGRLPISIPRNVGQIQTIYNHKPSQYFQKYKDDVSSALYPFGYGLSYTKYQYSNLTINKDVVSENESLMVSVDLENTGDFVGEETVQLYIRDVHSSVTRPVKELKAFKQVYLGKGEKQKLEFEIKPEMLEFYDINMNKTIEAGEFIIMLGSSSADSDLLKVSFRLE